MHLQGCHPISPVESDRDAARGRTSVFRGCTIRIRRCGAFQHSLSAFHFYSSRTMYIVFLVSFLPLVAGFGEMRCHYIIVWHIRWYGLDSCRKLELKFISLFCFVTRFKADKPKEFFSKRCEFSFVWPHTLSSQLGHLVQFTLHALPRNGGQMCYPTLWLYSSISSGPRGLSFVSIYYAWGWGHCSNPVEWYGCHAVPVLGSV